MKITNYKLQKGIVVVVDEDGTVTESAGEISGIIGIIEGQDRTIAIPITEANKEYRKYLAWVAEGNTPEPADE